MIHPKILVVDDEAEIRKSYRYILESQEASSSLDDMASFLFDEEEDLDNLEVEMDMLEEELLVEEDFDIGPYEIAYANQGQVALDLFQAAIIERDPFCLVFLDMRMPPGIDGLETAKQMRRLDPHVEIVIMTAYSDYSLNEIIEELGSEERLLYFHKPFQPDQVKQLASSLTQRWYLEKASREHTIESS